MMGIPIADIKEILAGNLDLKTSMTQRIDQLTEEELLMENTEIWQKKLLYTNLEEKAYFLNRKVSIILCLAVILLSFLPLVFYNDFKFSNHHLYGY